MKKIAVIVGGWHYPYHFYDKLNQMQIPNNAIVDKFVISHRSPDLDIVTKEKLKLDLGTNNTLLELDIELYSRIIKQSEIEEMNYTYVPADNVAGDCYFVQQWLWLYDYKQYDYIYFFHDDNYIINDKLLVDVLDKKVEIHNVYNNRVEINYDWLILYHSTYGDTKTARGSFVAFNTKLFDIMPDFGLNNKFRLNRTNQVDTPAGHDAITDWNAIPRNIKGFIERANIEDKVFRISPIYRCSPYMFECERGFCQLAKLPFNLKYLKNVI